MVIVRKVIVPTVCRHIIPGFVYVVISATIDKKGTQSIGKGIVGLTHFLHCIVVVVVVVLFQIIYTVQIPQSIKLN